MIQLLNNIIEFRSGRYRSDESPGDYGEYQNKISNKMEQLEAHHKARPVGIDSKVVNKFEDTSETWRNMNIKEFDPEHKFFHDISDSRQIAANARATHRKT